MTLQGIAGGRAPLRVGALQVHVGPAEPADKADVVVLEDDRYLLMNASDRIAVEPNPLRTLTRGMDAQPAELGTLVLRDAGGVLSIHAVVIDVDADPPVEEASVARAVQRVLAVCVARDRRRLQLPLLGVRGRLPLLRSAALIGRMLWAHAGPAPHTVRLLCADEQREAVRDAVLGSSAG